MPDIFDEITSKADIFDEVALPKRFLTKAAETMKGVNEAIAATITGLNPITQAASGFYGMGRGLAKGSLKEAGKGIEEFQKYFTYKPETPTGVATAGGLEKYVINPFIEAPSREAEQLTLKATGSPLAATVVGTGLRLGIPTAFGIRAKLTKPKATPRLTEIETQLKPTPEDIGVAGERLKGWAETDRVLGLEATRGKVDIFDKVAPEMPTPNVPVKGAYKAVTLPERAMAEMYAKLRASGLDDATIKAQMERIYPTEVVDALFESEVVKPTAAEVAQVVPEGQRAGLVTEFVPRVEGEVARPIEAPMERSDLSNLVPTTADVVPFTRRNYMAAGEERTAPTVLYDAMGESIGKPPAPAMPPEARLASESTSPKSLAEMTTQEWQDSRHVLRRLSEDTTDPTMKSWAEKQLRKYARTHEEQVAWSKRESTEAVTSGTVPKPSTETGAVTIPSGMGAALKEKGTSILRHVKEFFAPTSTLPEGGQWYKELRYKGLGDVDRAIGIGQKVFDKLKKLPDDSKFNIFQAVDGKIPMSDLSAADALVAKQIQNLNQRIGQMAVKRGILKEATFEANKDSYVKYLYLRHILPDDVQIKVTGGKIDFGWLKSRKDLTREQQRGIGLIEDISVAEPYGVMTSLGDMAKWDFFNKVAQDPRAVWTPGMVEWNGQRVGIGKLVEEVENQRRVVTQAPNVPEAQARLASLEQALSQAKEASGNVPEGFVQMPVSKSYGNLSGAFVAKPIFQDIAPVWQGFNSTGSTSKLLNMALNAERKAMAGFKVGKTALNLPTATRNVVSNFFQLAMSGMRMDQIPFYMERGLGSMLKKDANWNQARRYGLFKTNWGAAEIGEVLNTVRTLGKEKTGIFSMASNVARFYGKIDDVTKMAKFIEQLEKGAAPGKAAVEAHKWGMDYSLANPTIKVARQHVAPFVSYQYKIAPLIAETMKQRPWLIPASGLIPYLMSDVSRHVMNITDEQWNKLKKDMPLYIKENQTYTLLPWKSPQGNPQWVNIEYFMPWQNFIALGTDIKNAKWGDIPRDFGVGNPIFNTLSAWSSKGDEPLKDPFTRRPVYNTLDSPSDKAFKVSEWLMQTWGMPPMLSTKGAAGYTERAASGEVDKYGRTVTPGQAAARWFGVNVIAPSPSQSVRERQAIKSQLHGSLNQILKNPSVSAEKKAAAIKNYREQLLELQGGQQ